MKAAVLTALETVELQERPEPTAEPGWVVVKVESASLCGTDVHQYDGRIDTPFPRRVHAAAHRLRRLTQYAPGGPAASAGEAVRLRPPPNRNDSSSDR